MVGDKVAHGIEDVVFGTVDHSEGVGVGHTIEILREAVDLVVEVAGVRFRVLNLQETAVFFGVNPLIQRAIDSDVEGVAVGGHDEELGLGGSDGQLRQLDLGGVVFHSSLDGMHFLVDRCG